MVQGRGRRGVVRGVWSLYDVEVMVMVIQSEGRGEVR